MCVSVVWGVGYGTYQYHNSCIGDCDWMIGRVSGGDVCQEGMGEGVGKKKSKHLFCTILVWFNWFYAYKNRERKKISITGIHFLEDSRRNVFLGDFRRRFYSRF